MLTLDLSREPEWLDLPAGVRLLLRPLGTALMAAARSDAAVVAAAEGDDREAAAVALAKAIARRAVVEWEGIGDAAGNPVPPSPEGIDALLEIWPIFEAFQLGYVAKGLLLADEGNGSSPLPNGTSAGALASARHATVSAETVRRE
jgi:hypothetical protein